MIINYAKRKYNVRAHKWTDSFAVGQQVYAMEEESSVSSSSKSSKCLCSLRCKLTLIKSKGTIFLLVWYTVLCLFQGFLGDLAIQQFFTNDRLGWTLFYLSFLSFPVFGLLADSCIGRYVMILSGTLICFFSSAITLVGYGLFISEQPSNFLRDTPTPLPNNTLVNIILHTGQCINCVGIGAFLANFIPFATDQLVGASSEELSLLVHWYFWCSNAVVVLYYSIDVFIEKVNLTILWFVACAIPIALLTIVLVLEQYVGLKKRWLVTTPQLSNPIKLIAQVLNYARTNKVARKRSAFTYMDEEQPSRLDLANTKFGGPFTEGQVEDVKTTLRMIPLVICIPMFFVVYRLPIELPLMKSSFFIGMQSTLLNQSLFLYSIVIILYVPIYNFVILPLFSRYLPTMLRRICLAMCIWCVTVLGYVALNVAEHFLTKNNTTKLCYTEDHPDGIIQPPTSESDHKKPIFFSMEILLSVVMMFAEAVLSIESLEFILAQSPCGMKGLLFGLWYAVRGTAYLIGYYISKLFIEPIKISIGPGCQFFYLVTMLVLLLVILVVFMLLSKWYKLRSRHKTVNLHLIVENTWERYLKQEEEYLKALDISESVTGTVAHPKK